MSEAREPIEMVALCDAHDLAEMFRPHFDEQAPWIKLRRPREVEAPEKVAYALGYRPDPERLKDYPNLRLICSVAAGVEALLRQPHMPDATIISRLCDEEQAAMMAGFAVWHVIWHQRGMARYLQQRRDRVWDSFNKAPPSRMRVGVLGFGLMGKAVAKVLQGLGYPVSALVRSTPDETPKGIRLRAGSEGLAQIATESDILINVLPLTAETEGLLAAPFFGQMKKGAYLINLGRGQHLNEGDLIAALDQGQLSGASLDVFEREPLPQNSPLWDHPEVLITPHVASECDDAKVVSFAIAEIERFQAGQPLVGRVDRNKGY